LDPSIPSPTSPSRLFYATTSTGLRLPIIDVTHPSFMVSATPSDLDARAAAFVRDAIRQARVPRFIRRMMLRVFLRRSLIGPGLLSASGGFVDGLTTYLLKLGPGNLPASATDIDRRIADSFPAFATRLRLQDMAQLLADGVAERLRPGDCRALRLINIAGGPAADSLNALIVLARAHPALVEGRIVTLDILDADAVGPAVAARAAEALGAADGPLHGVSVTVRHEAYDWRDTAPLQEVLRAAGSASSLPLFAASSEGGLFEYGSDDAIVANLQAFAAGAGADAFLVGSVTSDSEASRMSQAATRVSVRPRSLAAFTTIAARAGWVLDRAIEGPLSFQVRLRRAGASESRGSQGG
jgi:hypothetical protein